MQTIAGSDEPLSQVKQLQDTLKNVKLTSEEREKVRELVEQGDTEGTQESIRKLLGELSAVEKRHRHDEKKLQKIASLYDTHNFWDT